MLSLRVGLLSKIIENSKYRFVINEIATTATAQCQSTKGNFRFLTLKVSVRR